MSLGSTSEHIRTVICGQHQVDQERRSIDEGGPADDDGDGFIDTELQLVDGVSSSAGVT